jgi:hypothetical protein
MPGLLDRRRELVQGLLAEGLPPEPVTPLDRLLQSYKRLWTDTNALQKVGMTNVPIVSDVAGLLGDIQQYREQPETRTGLNYALSGLGLLPFVPAVFGTFKGINANLTPAETEMLQKAFELEQKGLGREAIRQATNPPGGSGGWFRAPWDQKWRMELDDSKALVNASGPEGARVSNAIPLGVDPSLDIGPGGLLEHPELFSAYDKNALAAHTYISPSKTMLGSDRGSYNPTERSVTYFAPQTAEQARSTALHEVGGHGVQGVEGFARGGSPETLMKEAMDAQKTLEEFQVAAAMRALIDEGKTPEAAWKGIKEIYPDAGDTVKSIATRNDAREIESYVAAASDVARRTAAVDPYKKYLSLAGEAEARLVQARRDLTPAQRAALDPIEQMDTMLKQEGILGGLDDLIVRYGDGMWNLLTR